MYHKLGTKEEFLESVKNHKLTVLHDDGMYRHLFMSTPGTLNRHYHIVTWPGYLSISGDMGSATFTRIIDMFEFFRTETLGINYRYWTEKEVATSRFGENTEFDHDALPNLLNEWLEQWIKDHHPSDEEISKVKQAIKDAPHCENEYQVADYLYCIGKHDDIYPIYDQDWWENSFVKTTGYQEWRLFAINHAIREYDKLNGESNANQ